MNDYDRYQEKVGQMGVWSLVIVTATCVIGLVVWQLTRFAVLIVVFIGLLALTTVCGAGFWYATLSVRAARAMEQAANPNKRLAPLWRVYALGFLIAALVFGLLLLAKHP